jgi:hypothetical protein
MREERLSKSTQSRIQKVRIPASVGFIGEECFASYGSLREVVYERQGVDVAEDTFLDCPALDQRL